MAEFDIAHLHEQGQDMIIVPLDRGFGNKTWADQQAVIASLQGCAQAAGLRGTVVPVWEGSGGRMMFIAPQPWHRFFMSIDLDVVATAVNRRLICTG